MNGCANFRMMAGYNRWMNERLYALCAPIPDEERKRDRGAFFKSIHGTLNHLLLADRAWLGRFTGKPVHFERLDLELHANFDELRGARGALDREIESWVETLTEERLWEDVVYRNFKGTEFRHPLGPAVAHLFNHQTHHRGQLTTLLMQLGHDPGVTDVIAYYRL